MARCTSPRPPWASRARSRELGRALACRIRRLCCCCCRRRRCACACVCAGGGGGAGAAPAAFRARSAAAFPRRRGPRAVGFGGRRRRLPQRRPRTHHRRDPLSRRPDPRAPRPAPCHSRHPHLGSARGFSAPPASSSWEHARAPALRAARRESSPPLAPSPRPCRPHLAVTTPARSCFAGQSSQPCRPAPALACAPDLLKTRAMQHRHGEARPSAQGKARPSAHTRAPRRAALCGAPRGAPARHARMSRGGPRPPARMFQSRAGRVLLRQGAGPRNAHLRASA